MTQVSTLGRTEKGEKEKDLRLAKGLLYGGAGGYRPRVHRFISLVYPTGLGCLKIFGQTKAKQPKFRLL